MLRYEHECPEHGRFEVRRSIKDPAKTAPCPECGQECRKAVCFDPAKQVLIPAHFRTTLPMTGMRDNQGRSGEVENLHRDFNRWDSGAPGIKENPKHKERTAL